MIKKVSKKVKITQVQFQILKYLTQYLAVSQIARLRKTSKVAVYKTTYRLLDQGLVRKIGQTYELTNLGKNRLNSFIGLYNQIRLHNLAVKISILEKPLNWELKRSTITQIRTLSKEVDLRNTKYQIHSFSNIKLKTTTKSIIFYLPSTYGRDTDEAFREAIEMLFRSIPKVEHLFNIILIKDRKANMEIISNQYAKLQDSLARIYRIRKNKLYVKDEQGKIWLIADYSFRTDELETISPIKAKEDMDTVQAFLNDLRKTPVKPSQILGMIRDVTANQTIFAQNMESHIAAIQGLSLGVNKLTKAVGSIQEENIKLRKKLKPKEQTKLNKYFLD